MMSNSVYKISLDCVEKEALRQNLNLVSITTAALSYLLTSNPTFVGNTASFETNAPTVYSGIDTTNFNMLADSVDNLLMSISGNSSYNSQYMTLIQSLSIGANRVS